MLKNLHKKFSKVVFILVALLAFEKSSFAQKKSNDADQREKEGFMSLPEGIMKKEISSFNIAISFQDAIDSSYMKSVDEIPLLNCADSSVTFSKGGNPTSASVSLVLT